MKKNVNAINLVDANVADANADLQVKTPEQVMLAVSRTLVSHANNKAQELLRQAQHERRTRMGQDDKKNNKHIKKEKRI